MRNWRGCDFGCSIGSLPFTYFGMPLGLHKLAVKDFLPLVKKCEGRLLVTSNLLSKGGRLVMVNSILSSLPTFLMICSPKLNSTTIKQINKYRKHLRRGEVDMTCKKPSKNSMEYCLCSKEARRTRHPGSISSQ